MSRYERFMQNVEYDPAFVKQLQSTHKLFHERMQVMVPAYAAQSVEKHKLYGTVYNEGSTKEERDQYNRSMVKVWMAPIRHIILYSEGVPIAYPSRERAARIYFYIKDHVKTWNDLLSTSMNLRAVAPPLDDFELMLEFAENLDQFLEFYYKSGNKQNYFQRHTMNRFAADDKLWHRGDSTYSRLKEGVFSLLSNRVPRNDEPATKVNSTYQAPQSADITTADEFALENAIQR